MTMHRTITRSILTAAAMPLAAVAMAATAQTAAGQPGPMPAPLVSFAVTETVEQAPDQASLSGGVTTMAPTAGAAIRANAAAMERVLAALRRAGVEAKDLQTSGFSLSPQYDYRTQEQGQPPRLIGYQVANRVTATTRDIAGVGALIDAMASAGATDISGPSFGIADMAPLLEGARARAMQTANARAATYARLNGYAGARLVSLNEGGAMPPPVMPVMMEVAAAPMARMATPIAPGEVSGQLTLTVTYALTR